MEYRASRKPPHDARRLACHHDDVGIYIVTEIGDLPGRIVSLRPPIQVEDRQFCIEAGNHGRYL
jgi:hypothetical protein